MIEWFVYVRKRSGKGWGNYLKNIGWDKYNFIRIFGVSLNGRW